MLGIIIPIDFHIFQRGSKHQPDMNESVKIHTEERNFDGTLPATFFFPRKRQMRKEEQKPARPEVGEWSALFAAGHVVQQAAAAWVMAEDDGDFLGDEINTAIFWIAFQ